MNIIGRAIIFRETHGERSSRQLLTALNDHITLPKDLLFKRSYTTAKLLVVGIDNFF